MPQVHATLCAIRGKIAKRARENRLIKTSETREAHACDSELVLGLLLDSLIFLCEDIGMSSSLSEYIIGVPDFPKRGILFRDFSPLLRHRFAESVDAIAALFSDDEWRQIDVITGIESRGFILASALALKKEKGLVLIRKAGKMPNAAAQVTYDLEYGNATIEMQLGSGRALVVDDVLATGGTLRAAGDLCSRAGYDVHAFAVLLNLKELNDFRWNGFPARAALEFSGTS
jgi:adenine phosphoribosyltransferase